MISTTPLVPSTRRRWPVLMREVAVPVPDHGREAVFARDDRRVRHDPADVGDGRLDLAEDRRPGRRGDRADQDLAVAHLRELLQRAHHARRALDLAGRRRVAAELRPGPVLRPRPGLQAFLGHAPEHHHHRVVDRLGHRPEGRRRSPRLEPLEQFLAPVDDRRPAIGAERLAAGGPGQSQLLECLLHLESRELEDVLALDRGSGARRGPRRTHGSC